MSRTPIAVVVAVAAVACSAGCNAAGEDLSDLVFAVGVLIAGLVVSRKKAAPRAERRDERDLESR